MDAVVDTGTVVVVVDIGAVVMLVPLSWERTTSTTLAT